MPTQHSINVLPKWARVKILNMEAKLALLKSCPLNISIDSTCEVTLQTPYSSEVTPKYLIAGDTISIARPILKVNDIPVRIKCGFNNEAILRIRWGDNNGSVH